MIRSMLIDYYWLNSETKKSPPKKHQADLENAAKRAILEGIGKEWHSGNLAFEICLDANNPSNVVTYFGHWSVEYREE